MYNIPDHPVIRSMERTGYPYWFSEPELLGYCNVCGKPIYEGDRYAERYYDRAIVCEDCMMADDEPMYEEV